jgi:type I restriction enzyme S subunit
MKAEEQRATDTATQASVVTEWPIVPFEKVATPQSDRGKRIKQRDYLPAGRIPVIDQGQALVGGYTDDEDFAFAGELPVVLFGDHTRAVKLVSHRFAVGADGIKIFRPAEGVRPKYLYYWMKSARIPDRGYGRHYQYLRQLSVPLPPPAKQDEIVAEIEKQFSRLDEAVANLKRVKANLKRYKAAVLKAAVEGRLVKTEAKCARREGRSYEGGAQLLYRILETRRSQWKGKGRYKEPAAPDTANLPELPEGWVWASVDQLVAHLTDGDHQAPPQTNQGIPFLVIGNVRSGEIDFSDTRFVGEAYYKSLDPSRQPRLGDLLYTLVGSYGIPVRVTTEKPFCIQRHMAILRPHEHSPMSYLTLAMASGNVFRQATAVATGTAQLTVPLAGLRRIVIPLPPIGEQERIIAEVDRRLSILRETEAHVDANLQRAVRLQQSILSKGFSEGFSDMADSAFIVVQVKQ